MEECATKHYVKTVAIKYAVKAAKVIERWQNRQNQLMLTEFFTFRYLNTGCQISLNSVI